MIKKEIEKSKTVVEIPHKTDKKAIITFLYDEEDKIWEDAVAEDFMKGYPEKDADYDKL